MRKDSQSFNPMPITGIAGILAHSPCCASCSNNKSLCVCTTPRLRSTSRTMRNPYCIFLAVFIAISSEIFLFYPYIFLVSAHNIISSVLGTLCFQCLKCPFPIVNLLCQHETQASMDMFCETFHNFPGHIFINFKQRERIFHLFTHFPHPLPKVQYSKAVPG